MKPYSDQPPITLTIAGSDSGGGAGIQADLKTFHQLRCFGTSVITAVTAQNTLGVRGFQAIDESIVAAQLDAVLSDLPPKAIKTGMLATAGVIESICNGLSEADFTTKWSSENLAENFVPLIVDPVMVATSGDSLLDPGAESALQDRLLPMATLISPNIPEAEKITGKICTSTPERVTVGQGLADKYQAFVLLKGGHDSQSETIKDLLFTPGSDAGPQVFSNPRVISQSTHGTGCTLSASVAALWAGRPFKSVGDVGEIVGKAIEFVQRGIKMAPGYGKGHGPLSHFVDMDF